MVALTVLAATSATESIWTVEGSSASLSVSRSPSASCSLSASAPKYHLSGNARIGLIASAAERSGALLILAPPVRSLSISAFLEVAPFCSGDFHSPAIGEARHRRRPEELRTV